MKETNYSKIAKKYDKNKFRHNIELDIDIKKIIEGSDNQKLKFLDLSCGTGIYLSKQIQYFNEEYIEWHGLDASQDMLDKAKDKTSKALLKRGLAEYLPYDSEYFDFIVNNYAFQHYQEKPKVLDEVARVVKRNGIFKMHNISIHDMKKWWIYEFFPSAYSEDLKRFWNKELIFKELSIRDFDVKIHMEYKMEAGKIADFMGYVYNRDISVLTLISDDEFNSGVKMMENMIKKDPQVEVVNDFAEIFFVATKR
ncbi:class I SAM-dependent methyltransferase [Brassicibacter mesophilus]|uniref:class I SAM-dependent methyltransferase n=1 Tax=Brassicibacter mesophilus TaxID=745119 RepID=UPI003D22B826